MRQNTKLLARTALLSALTAVGAFIKIPLGVSSVTLQFFFTAMAGCLLPPLWSAASQGVYVLLGLVGLPIFTMGKYFERDGKRMLPLAIQVHHAVCDGYHVGMFVERLQGYIDNFSV